MRFPAHEQRVTLMSSAWPRDNNFSQMCYAFPPVNDVAQALLLAQRISSQPNKHFQLALITPLWRSHTSFHLLCPDSRHFRPEIKAYLLLERGADILPGPVGRPDFLTAPHTGHRLCFAAVLWDTRPISDSRPPISSFRHRFCMARHYNETCDACDAL